LTDKLIIFDYSGTLSLDAIEFSNPEKLISHLQESGLFELGVDNAALFWEIVNSTWEKGSTTQLGYKTVLEERFAELFPQKAAENRAKLIRSISKFVDAYLHHSRIENHWQSILRKLSQEKSTTVIIATDHYAEATEAIIKHLGKWGIKAAPFSANMEENFIIANSADMGVYKCSREFWQIVKNSLKQDFKQILIIDDFGVNEQPDDAYADAIKIKERRKFTEKILGTVFAAHVESIFFAERDKQIQAMIAETSAIIDQFLNN
jgi:FMN phosphatase YigB (HAD superfamily)